MLQQQMDFSEPKIALHIELMKSKVIYTTMKNGLVMPLRMAAMKLRERYYPILTAVILKQVI